jgi:uroporphyrinogen-III synthase
VSAFIDRILNGEVGVVAFTSAPQVRMLFDFAAQLGIAAALEKALKGTVVIASIGEVTNRALEEKGLTARIVPTQSKMGALAQAVADYYRRP